MEQFISKELAVKLLKLRDELLKSDVQEAYHILYSIADPSFKKMYPWEDIQHIANGDDNLDMNCK